MVEMKSRTISTLRDRQSRWLYLLGIGLVWGCSSSSIPPHQSVHTQLPPTPDQVAWTSTGETVVARVGSKPIYASTVRLIMQLEPSLSPRQALDRAIEIEAISADGASKFGASPPSNLVHRYRQLLVQRFLQKNFEEDLTVTTVPDKYLKKAFKVKKVRKHFIHYDTFFVRDLQLICCSTNHVVCAQNLKKNAPCFEKFKQESRRLRKFVLANKPKTADEFSALVDRAKEEINPRVQHQKFDFYYDVNESYKANQARVDRMTRAVNEGVLTLEIGDISPVLSDQYGYHILYLENHIPEANGSLADVEVRKELSEKIFPAVQREEFMQSITQSFRAYHVTLDDEALKSLRAFGRQPEPEAIRP